MYTKDLRREIISKRIKLIFKVFILKTLLKNISHRVFRRFFRHPFTLHVKLQTKKETILDSCFKTHEKTQFPHGLLRHWIQVASTGSFFKNLIFPIRFIRLRSPNFTLHKDVVFIPFSSIIEYIFLRSSCHYRQLISNSSQIGINMLH